MVGQRNAAFAEESAEVEVLLASFNKTADLTKRIKASLTRLDHSGRTVKDAIGPINSGTQQLQTISGNITKINEAIERLRQPIDSKAREETIIRAGPQSAGLQQYLGALKRIDRAITDLNSTNIRSNQQAITEFHSLLSTGVNQLLDLYRQALEEDAARIEPLHYITKGLEFPTYSQDKVTHLSQIASAIVAASAQSERLGRRDDDPAVKLYASIRGEYISSSLQVSAMGSISTSKRRTNDTSIYTRSDQNGIGLYAQALEGMLSAEHQNVTRVFRGDVADRVFAETSSKAISNFAKTIAELNIIIKARLMTDCFLAYEILEVATPMAYRLESRTGQLKSQLSDAIRPIRDTARSSLSEILNRTKSQADQITTLPVDGNTIPLVHDTAARLKALAEFDKPLSSLLTSVGDNGWRKDPNTLTNPSSSTLNLDLASPTSPDSSDKLLPNYLSDILDTLLLSLAQRSQAIHRANRALQGIFMLNTIAILNRAITTSESLQIYIPPSPSNAKLEVHRKTAAGSYLAVWRDPSAYLFDQISTTGSSRPMSGQAIDSTSIVKSLGSKDKDKIKEKFRGFNASFDDLVVKHRAMYMEKEVKNSVGREISGIIEPLYARFWDRYHEVDKGKGKVVKYSKGELSALLSSL